MEICKDVSLDEQLDLMIGGVISDKTSIPSLTRPKERRRTRCH
jgi:hypothetical protein